MLMDNHESHCSLEAMQFVRENSITFVTFPLHSSHKLQLLDVAVLGPFKSKMKIAQSYWLTCNPDKTISVRKLPSLVNIAESKAILTNHRQGQTLFRHLINQACGH